MKTKLNKIFSVLAVFFFCLTNFTASAANISANTVIYFDVTGYPEIQASIAAGNKLQVMVGHSSWSQGYEMKKVDGYDYIYSVTMPKWDGCTQLAFMTASSVWGGEGSSVTARVAWGLEKTRVFTVSLNMSGNVGFSGSTGELLSRENSYTLPEIVVKYYVAGNGVSDNPWCNGITWNEKAPENELIDGTITFSSVPAGNYKFKITKGTWDSPLGDGAIDKEKSTKNDCRFKDLGGDDDANVDFTTTETANITITFKDSKITVTADFASPLKEDSYVLMGVGKDWEVGIPLQLAENSEDDLMLLNQHISKTEDAVKVVQLNGCNDKLNYYATISASTTAVPFTFDKDGNIVLEDGIYDFYFNKTTGAIRIDGALNEYQIVYLDPVVYNAGNPGTWTSDDARIALYAYQSKSTNTLWTTAIRCGEIYYAYLPIGYDMYIWCRMNPAKDENRWNPTSAKDYVWNQTAGIVYNAENQLTKLTGWDDNDDKVHYQEPYKGTCGINYDDLECDFPTLEGDAVFVTINQFVDSDPCNYLFESFEQAFAVLKNNTDICDAQKVYYGSFKQDAITLKKPVVMQVVFGPEPYRGTEVVGMSGGHIGNAPAIFIRNINMNGEGAPLIIRTADPKGNRAVIVHPVIRRSTNITLDNLDIISDPELRDNAIDIDTGEGAENLEGLNKDFNKVPLSDITHNITLKNCFVESYGRNGIHVVGIKGINVENNEFYTKYDFSVDKTEGEDVVDWGGTIKFINTTDVKFLRNNSEGTLATSFFIQGCQRVLLMNNVFWNNNEVQVEQLSEGGRTVANVRLVNYGEKAADFPLKNIGIYYNTFYIKDNPSTELAGSYVKFDFFRLGGLMQPVDNTNKDNFDPKTIRFQYNNCYSYDNDIEGNNDVYSEETKIIYYLQGIGQNPDWCQCFKYNNFWSEYDKALEAKDANHISSTFEICKFCTGEKETYNAYVNVRNQVCQTDPTNPSALVVKGGSLNIGTVITDDVSGQGADKIFTDRLNGDNENPIRPTIVVDNSNESLSPSDHIYKEPGTIQFYTSPIVGSQTTDVHISSVSLTQKSKVYLSIVDGDVSYFTITDGSGKSLPTDDKGMYLTTDGGSLDNHPIYVTFKRPTGQTKDAIFSAFLQILPASENALKMLIRLKGYNTVDINEIPGAWTVGAFQQREVQPVDTIIWRGASSSDWDDRNNWYKIDGTLVTCLDALTENLTVIIPKKDSERYVTPANGITTYPTLPKMSNEYDFGDARTETYHGEQVNAGPNDSKQTTKVAHKIFMEYGATLVGVEQLNANTRRYNEVEMEFIARRHDWLLVGPVVRPWELDENGNQILENNIPKTRNVVSRDYFLNHFPHVYMHRAEMKRNEKSGNIEAMWNNSFADLDSVVTHTKAFAIRIPDQYGRNLDLFGTKVEKLPAKVYNQLFGGDYDGNAPHTYNNFKGNFYNEKNLPVYKLEKEGVPVLLNNTYPANLKVGNLEDKGGTVQIYDYSSKTFRDANADELIMSQHGFVFTPGSENFELKISPNDISNTETGHRSANMKLPEFRVQLSNNSKSTASVVAIRYDEFKADKMNYAVDAPKIFNTMETSAPELYVIRYENKWSGINIPTLSEPIPLGIDVRMSDQTFRFTLQKSNTDFDVILDDRLEGKQYNLSAGEMCTVENLAEGQCEGRFYLMLQENEDELPDEDVSTDIEESKNSNSGIDIFTQENSVVISSDVELQTVMVSDVTGRYQVYNVSGQYVKLDLPVSAGVYTISVIGDKATRVEKIKLN